MATPSRDSTPGRDPPGTPYSPYYNPATRFNPTMAVLIITLIGGCFILGFVSVFIRRCMRNGQSGTDSSTNQSAGSAGSGETRGLDKAAVDALPIVHVKDLEAKDDRECPVCLTEFEPDETLRLLPNCKHIFHQECIDAWFDSHSTCPLCRASLLGHVDHDGAQNPSTHGGHAAPLNQLVEDVSEVSASGDSDGESHSTSDVVPAREDRADAAVPAVGATISREDERSSARGALSRNSQSFKRIARGIAAYEKAAAASPGRSVGAGGQFQTNSTASSTKKPPTSTTNSSMRRSTSLGTDLISLRNLLMGGESNVRRENSTGASYRLNAAGELLKPEIALRRRDNYGAYSSPSSRDQWVTIDLETGKVLPAESGESSKADAGVIPERAWSDRWSLAGLRSAMFARSRSTSDASPHLPV